MTEKLSPVERETLILFLKHGSGGAYDVSSLNKLFRFGLIEITAARDIVLTPAGRKACKKAEAMKDKWHG